MELLNIKNLVLFECSRHSKARSIARASTLKSETGTVIWNAMTVTVICEHCCCRDPTVIFRTICDKGDVLWKPVSYEVLVVIREWCCVGDLTQHHATWQT